MQGYYTNGVNWLQNWRLASKMVQSIRTRLSSSARARLLPEFLGEEVAAVPGWSLRLLSHVVADQEVQTCALGRRIVIKRLVHVVLGRVVEGGHPGLDDLLAIQLGVGTLQAIADVHRGNALADERVLVAADEEHFFRHGIGTDLVTHHPGCLLHVRAQR